MKQFYNIALPLKNKKKEEIEIKVISKMIKFKAAFNFSK